MKNIQSKLETFKQIAIKNFQNENFTYHEFFVNDHLMIVERIAMELCNLYPEADRDVVSALVWFHDFGKPFDEENERALTEKEGINALRHIGFEESFIQKVFESWQRMEMKNEIDISKESIEVQIISSADGASHFVGKFYASYFGDEPKVSLKITEERILKKITKDWERKITLPEVKKAFEGRYRRALEIVGEYPNKFLDI